MIYVLASPKRQPLTLQNQIKKMRENINNTIKTKIMQKQNNELH